MVKAGTKVPEFQLVLDDGSIFTNNNCKDGYTVLYFYPKDMTSGCTVEAQDFTALKADFQKLNARIIGVSKDSTESHCNFIKKESLKISLGTDESGAACEAFGVWQEKSMYGKKYMGIDRSTFLIDPSGKVLEAWRKVKVPEHAKEVLSKLKELTA